MHRLILVWVCCLVILSACDNKPTEPLIQVATPNAPDAGFVTYQHQTGVFTIRVPPSWIPNELPDANGARVEFSTLEGQESIVRLSVYVINTGTALTREAFLQTTNNYLPPEDLASYEWQALEAPIDQADGSRRVVGVRYYPSIGSRALNIFLQANGRYFSALEADVTTIDENTLSTLQTVINTFRVNADVFIQEGAVVSGVAATGNISFEGYAHWVDKDGGFNITGFVKNNQETSVEAVRLTGYVFDARNNRLSEESSILTQDVLHPGEYAPFRLRFEGGQPSTAVRYELEAAARIADFSLRNFYGGENFTKPDPEVTYNDNGNLVFRGILSNGGTRLVRNVKIIVSLINEQGQVIGTETQFINKDQLLPGEVDNYEIVVYDLGGAPFRYEMTVMGTAE